ncbi:molybdenum cofactor guanylyltransferase [Peteryoungia desertarenae]|uniref:Molybdenum cofactor guanylyltransferase n=1 Tax=Peteryoungia desertarenae TaxID=1813451 RepID=A0ABX6QQC9_9HYPH|nr:molybdenum cofactor guanylyltransferase MobA [Peteryoungia desertarenae]QLF70745.1 molybdenum cofactor guanylyltransferase [Peteryoungia desertarenae]
MTAKLSTALILAGGLSRRMGQDKTQVELAGKPLIRHVIERLSPQLDILIISAPGPHPAAAELIHCVDTRPGHLGPLAGILSGLLHLQEMDDSTTHLLVSPADTPFLPQDLAKCLLEHASPETVVIATSCGRSHPLASLWPLSLATDLDRWLDKPDNRRVQDYIHRHRHVAVPFEQIRIGSETIDPFFNINRPEDLAIAEHCIKRAESASIR